MSDARTLDAMSVNDLVVAFTKLAIQQDDAILDLDITRTNRLFRKLRDIASELKSRSGDQRKALITLYEHPNPQVRLKAAEATLAISPMMARQVLEKLRTLRNSSQQLDAGMTLNFLDQGVFKPT